MDIVNPGLSNYVVLEMVRPLELSVFLLIESFIAVTSSIQRCNVRSTIRLDNPCQPYLYNHENAAANGERMSDPQIMQPEIVEVITGMRDIFVKL